jgi:RNA polymerase sigma-70 factor (ECF subfamily)
LQKGRLEPLSNDRKRWQEFFDRYWKLIYSAARKSGLSEAEAQEVVQETIITVAKRVDQLRYDPERGSFKGWLLHITRWRIADQFRKRRPHEKQAVHANDDRATRTIDRVADSNGVDLDALWEEEWQQNLLAAAVKRVKAKVSGKQFQIFDCYVRKEWPPQRVAVAQANLDLGTQWRQEFYGKNLTEHLRLTHEVLGPPRPALVVPAAIAMTFFVADEPLYRQSIALVLGPADVQLLAGGVRVEDRDGATRYYNAAFLLDPTGEVVAHYDKQHLLPFAEYFPFGSIGVLKREFGRVREFTPGAATSTRCTPQLLNTASVSWLVVAATDTIPGTLYDAGNEETPAVSMSKALLPALATNVAPVPSGPVLLMNRSIASRSATNPPSGASS